MTKLTFKEENILSCIDFIIEDEWGMIDEINPPAMLNITPKGIAGVLGNLTKKGLIECDRDEGIDWVKFTKKGIEALN